MTTDELKNLLSRLQCVRVGSSLMAQCPCCQEFETEPEKFRLLLNPGASYAILVFCVKCMIPKPSTDVDRQHNQAVSRAIWQSVGVDLSLAFKRMESGEVRRLWASIKLGGHVQEEQGRASDQMLHMAYISLLSSLALNDRHRNWLRKRGICPDHCYEIGYRSGDGPVHSAIDVDGVPGLVDREWKVRRDCLLVPCRDKDGLIGALKMRLFDKSRRKMRTLSSSGWGGAKGQAIIHYPFGVTSDPDVWWITEGERKADALYFHKQVNVVGLPGVNFVSKVVGLGCKSAILAFDNDKAGGRCTVLLGQALHARGVSVRVAKWVDYKGVDDAIAAGAEVRIDEWEEEAGGKSSVTHPQLKVISQTRLKDHEVLGFIRNRGSVLRSEVNCYPPLISDMIRKGIIKMTKTERGQLLEVRKD